MGGGEWGVQRRSNSAVITPFVPPSSPKKALSSHVVWERRKGVNPRAFCLQLLNTMDREASGLADRPYTLRNGHS